MSRGLGRTDYCCLMTRPSDDTFGQLIPAKDAAALLGVPTTRIKQLERENLLVTVRSGKTNHVPASLLEPLTPAELAAATAAAADSDEEDSLQPATHRLRLDLRGTLTLLLDAGFTREEAAAWLWALDEELGQTPLDAILDGHQHHVNRIAATLGF